MRTLVTGGAGFIGSHLTELLVSEGHQVIVVDNLVSGRLENLSGVMNDGRVSFHQTDVTDRTALAPSFAGVDWVFHLAGITDIGHSVENPTAYFTTNVNGTLNVLECAREAGARRLVYAAAASSYGIPDLYPTPETTPIRPLYPCALTKYMGEELLLHWARVYRLPVLSLRLFNVYGPRSLTSGAYGTVFGVFLAQKLACEPFTVVGDGTQTRDFTYVTDVARAFLMAAQSQVAGLPLNVGSGGHYSINHLVELLGGPVTFIPKRPGEPGCTFADTARIRRLLGWRPQVGFEEGVARMMAHIQDWRSAPLWNPASIARATRTWFQYLRKDPEP